MLEAQNLFWKEYWRNASLSLNPVVGFGQALLGYGYPFLKVNGKHEPAHRLSYKEHKGPIPEGMQVCHSCDVRLCINPDHLWLGTARENQLDKVKKGRQAKGDLHGSRTKMVDRPRGEKHYASVLKENDVREIRKKMSNGTSMSALSREYGVHLSTINCIKSGRSWKNVS